MTILVDRKYKQSTYTIGKCYINGTYFSDTLEDKDRGLSSNMSPQDITRKKIYGETAIPTGTYEVQMTYSPKFAGRAWGKKYSGNVPQILNVKGFDGVRIHPGNQASESLGCIFLGRNLAKGKVLQSTEYYYKLIDSYILPALKRGEKIEILIR